MTARHENETALLAEPANHLFPALFCSAGTMGLGAGRYDRLDRRQWLVLVAGAVMSH